MCGIVAIAGPDVERNRAYGWQALRQLHHRGDPQCAGEISEQKRSFLGANRMHVRSDLEERQPCRSERGRVLTVLNGEIYNAVALANAHGVPIKRRDGGARSDTAIMADLLDDVGESIVSELDGMFAIAWLAPGSNILHIARDRVGVKPLYWASVGPTLLVASELKALCLLSDVREVHEVTAGTISEYRSGRLVCKSCFGLNAGRPEPRQRDELTPLRLREALQRSVDDMCADARDVGVLLSAGVDSGAVFALAKRTGSNVTGICLATNDGSDGFMTRRLATALGGRAVVAPCPSEEELFHDLPGSIRVLESFEPNVVRQGSVSRAISVAARRQGLRVILCGEGADELFCGYPEFQTAEDWIQLRSCFLVDLPRTQLQRVDRSSMEQTLEVRVPFLSNEIVALALNCSDRTLFMSSDEKGVARSKVVLREALRGLLPEFVRERPKVVLSEGAGLGGNDPKRGLFAVLAENAVSDDEYRVTVSEHPEWTLRTKEEVLYFLRFKELGYAKATFMRKRVTANRTHTVAAEGPSKARDIAGGEAMASSNRR